MPRGKGLTFPSYEVCIMNAPPHWEPGGEARQLILRVLRELLQAIAALAATLPASAGPPQDGLRGPLGPLGATGTELPEPGTSAIAPLFTADDLALSLNPDREAFQHAINQMVDSIGEIATFVTTQLKLMKTDVDAASVRLTNIEHKLKRMSTARA